VAGLLKHHYLAQAIADVGFSESRRQLRDQATWYGSQVVVLARRYPSSKTCSRRLSGCFAATMRRALRSWTAI